jgi:hypothetical protein
MSAVAEMFNVGGTPHQNAALAVVMFATMSTEQAADRDRLVNRASAAGIVTGLLAAAAAAGFRCSDEFRALVDGGQMTPRLEQLAADVVSFAGGAEKIFNLIAMALTPTDSMGARQRRR